MTSLMQHRHPLINIHEDAKIGDSVRIEPFTTIYGNVVIGEGTWIGSNVTIYDGVTIGENCRIMPGTVISADVHSLPGQGPLTEIPSNGHSPRVYIGNHVHLEPNVIIRGEVIIGDHTWIGSNVTLYDGTRIGRHCRLFPGAVIAAIPQDLKFNGERTTAEIGDYSTIRECVTINRGTVEYGRTVVGSRCLIMAYVHVAHDCVVGDHCVLANCVQLAGHVHIGEYAILGGTSAVHQFVKIGKHAMISGGSLVRKDVPPYVKAGREPMQYEGVNSVGLRRRGFDSQTVLNIKEMYRHIFLSEFNTSQALDHIENTFEDTAERSEVVTFLRKSKRGIIKSPQSGTTDDDDE